MSFSKSNYRNKNNSVRNSFVYKNNNNNSKFNPNNDSYDDVSVHDKNKRQNNNEDLNVCSGVFDVGKSIEKKRMSLIYPVESPVRFGDLSKKGKYNQKSASSVTLNKNRYSKSARSSNLTSENVSLKFLQRAQTTNQPRLKQQQPSINKVLCQQCLKYHLDKCNLCYNESSMDDLDNEYYYRNAIESSGSLLKNINKILIIPGLIT